MSLPDQIRIVEVGPRDGLQNEAAIVPVAIRIALVEKLLAAGVKSVEVGSFVSPKWVPQMADSAQVLSALVQKYPDANLPVLVPNEQGLDAALAAGAREIAIFGAASESFSRKNLNCSIEESFARFEPVVRRALTKNIRVRGYVSCVLGCPYEGEIVPSAVVKVSTRMAELGCYEISLGDTIGVGTPLKARNIVREVADNIGISRIAVHFHDTYGQALANIFATMEEGVRTVDSSVGGLGGCPYAKGSSGNVATESLVYMLNGMGVESGVDLEKLLDAAAFISNALPLDLRSNVYRALRLS